MDSARRKPRRSAAAPPKIGEKPDHAAENSGERSGLFGGEIQPFLQVKRERSKCTVVGEALENLGDIRDPEGPLEASADFAKALGKGQTNSNYGQKVSVCVGGARVQIRLAVPATAGPTVRKRE